MQSSRDKFFPCSAFSGDQDGGTAGPGAFDLPDEVKHDGAFPHEYPSSRGFLHLLFKLFQLHLQASMVHCALKCDLEQIDFAMRDSEIQGPFSIICEITFIAAFVL